MKKILIALVFLAMATGAAQAQGWTEDFEGGSGWEPGHENSLPVDALPLVGTYDPDDPANNVLRILNNEVSHFPISGPGTVTMDIYDPGAIKHDEGQIPFTEGDYGPRWGVMGNIELGDWWAPVEIVAITIIDKTFLDCAAGYGMNPGSQERFFGDPIIENDITGSWSSPVFYERGGTSTEFRYVDSLSVVGTGTCTNPEVPGDGDWTTWTFVVDASGNVEISDNKLATSTNYVEGLLGTDDELAIVFSGGKLHAAHAELSTHGMLVDNIVFTPAGTGTITADFTADVTAESAPLTVTFTDASSGGTITSYDWNFGDGDTTNTASATMQHTYDAGTYTVAMTATGPGGSDTETKTDYITAYSADLVSTEAAGSGVLKLTFNTTGLPDYFDLVGRSDLTTGSWGYAPHSDDGINPFVVTDLSYSTDEGGGNYSVYVETTGSEAFYGLE